MSSNGHLKAFEFQKQTVFTVEREFNGRALIANDMGLGKSPTALWFLKRKSLGETLPCLIICPKIVKNQWRDLIHKMMGLQPDILETRTPSKDSFGSQIALIHWDIIVYWRDWLEAQNYQTIILDECQAATNPKAKRTRTATALAKQIPFCLALSGTPLTNRPIELFPILNCINPKIWHNRNAYAHKYCAPRWTRYGWDFRGASNVNELHQRLKQSVMVRYRKDEVEHQLPDKIRTIIPVDLPHYEEYLKAKKDFVGWLKEKYPERMSKAVKAAALVQAGHLLRLAAKLKLRPVVEWINDRLSQSDEKLAVFCVHRKCCEALKRRIKGKSVIINGSVTGKDRDLAIHQFKKDKNTRTLIGNMAAAGIGLNLTEASTMAIVELAQKPGPLLQVEDRLHRIGQTKTTWIYYFIGVDTIEEKVAKLVQKKNKIITGTLDGGGEDDDSFDLYDLLLQELDGGISHETNGSPK